MSNTTAETIMSRNPLTCTMDDTLEVAARRMWEHDVGALPVTDATGQTVGMITDRDIAMAAYIQGKPLGHMDVKSAMSVNLWCVQPHSSITEVETLMQEHQVRRIPVVDGARHPVGMISLNDLARRAGAPDGARVSREEVARTLSAVCEPRAPMMAS